VSTLEIRGNNAPTHQHHLSKKKTEVWRGLKTAIVTDIKRFPISVAIGGERKHSKGEKSPDLGTNSHLRNHGIQGMTKENQETQFNNAKVPHGFRPHTNGKGQRSNRFCHVGGIRSLEGGTVCREQPQPTPQPNPEPTQLQKVRADFSINGCSPLMHGQAEK